MSPLYIPSTKELSEKFHIRMNPVGEKTDENFNQDIIVFSHLRWEFVTQRPQHLMTRLAKLGRKVLFIEEPIPFDESERGTARVFSPAENITVVQPKIDGGNVSALCTTISRFTPDYFSTKPVLWFYSAAFEEVIDSLEYSLIVYDCMDELSQFRGASKHLVNQEKMLLSRADLVFTGGKSLYDAKKNLHPNVHCFPSSIDQKHFAKAFSSKLKAPYDIASIPGPIVGFYGVIDERIDLALLSQVAFLLPTVSFVMIGPVVKIDPNSLPHASNIYYLGNKDYEQLPSYLKFFHIAFMPFALNKSTQFISPTKTLEFMAALKPIISTPIYDVKRDYSKEVKIVKNSMQMSKAIIEYLHESAQNKKRREAFQMRVLSKTSWDVTATNMNELISEQEQRNELEQTPAVGSYALSVEY